MQANHPSLHDDLWGQYWLAGVAAGLAYCHKAGQPEEQRLAGLIYAAANLKRYAAVFKLPQPTSVELLYDESQAVSASTKKPKHNLPAQPTPFIGRTAQLAALKEMILKPDVRLITLMGPGGTGKTRLSLQVAQETLEIFAPVANRLGIWQIKWELEDLSFRFLQPEPYKQIARWLDEKRIEREAGIERVRQELADGKVYTQDAQRATALHNRDAAIEEELMTALTRWEELSARA